MERLRFEQQGISEQQQMLYPQQPSAAANHGFYGRENDAGNRYFYPEQANNQTSSMNGTRQANKAQLSSQSVPFMSASSVPNFASLNQGAAASSE